MTRPTPIVSVENPPAFPHMMVEGHRDYAPGMTLRDWFAGQALAGLLASKIYHNAGTGFPEFIAAGAGNIADAMLAERSKP